MDNQGIDPEKPPLDDVTYDDVSPTPYENLETEPTYHEVEDDAPSEKKTLYPPLPSEPEPEPEPDPAPTYDEVVDYAAVTYKAASPSGVNIMSEDANNDGVADDAIFEFPAHVKLDYGHTVSEPEYLRTKRMAAKVSAPVGTCLRGWFDSIHFAIYYLLTIIFGAVLAVVWGIVFGIVNFFTVWLVQPFIKLGFTVLRCGYMVLRVWVRMCWDPIYQSYALQLSRMKGRFVVDVKGLETGKDMAKEI